MTGNDIVDLKRASKDSNWKRKGYLNKIFSTQEQEFISNASLPEEMVWLLWSMKEAAYKIYNTSTGIREYAPLKLKCHLIKANGNCWKGKININGLTYFSKSTISHGKYIHTLAAECEQELLQTREKLYHKAHFDYKAMAPTCVSHHGDYLALIF